MRAAHALGLLFGLQHRTLVAFTPGRMNMALRLSGQCAPTRRTSWSNPLGLTLTAIRDNLWLAERPFYPTIPGLTTTDVGGKMAVIRLPDGSLWVHSPVELDNSLEEALRELGPVMHIVTPNTEHQKYARNWIERFPEATSYACPGLREAKPDVGWTQTVGSGGAPASWGGVIDLCWIDAERVPLMIRPFFSEVVFLHKPSKTLIVTDLWWNYPTGLTVPRATRLWKFGMDAIYAPFYNNVMQIKPVFEQRLRMILGWDFDYIAPCHGEPVDVDAKGILARHLGY